MSVDDPTRAETGPGLGDYIISLIDVLGVTNPAALARMRQVVGERCARIKLDEETVDVFFDATVLHVQPVSPDRKFNGRGETDSTTVLALLDGYLEVSDAILNGRLRVFGEQEDITRMFVAIEILLDASPRTPTLQGLAAQFRHEHRRTGYVWPKQSSRSRWYPFGSSGHEIDWLSQQGLLP